MKIHDHYGNSIFLEAVDAGEHTSILTIEEKEGGGTVTASFILRPDSAKALVGLIDAWAEDRIRKDGLF